MTADGRTEWDRQVRGAYGVDTIFGPTDQAIGSDGQPCAPTGLPDGSPGYIDAVEIATEIGRRK